MYVSACLFLKVSSRKHKFLFYSSLCLEGSTLQDFSKSSSLASFQLSLKFQFRYHLLKMPFMTIQWKEVSPVIHTIHTDLWQSRYSSLPEIIISVFLFVSHHLLCPPSGSLWQSLWHMASSQTLVTELTGWKTSFFKTFQTCESLKRGGGMGGQVINSFAKLMWPWDFLVFLMEPLIGGYSEKGHIEMYPLHDRFCGRSFKK